MIPCDICKNNINTLKELYHSIPLGDSNIVVCDSCYKKVLDDLKRKEEYEE